MLPYSNIQHIDGVCNTWNTEQWENSLMRHFFTLFNTSGWVSGGSKSIPNLWFPLPIWCYMWCCWQQLCGSNLVWWLQCITVLEDVYNLQDQEFSLWCSHIPRWQCHHTLIHTNSVVFRIKCSGNQLDLGGSAKQNVKYVPTSFVPQKTGGFPSWSMVQFLARHGSGCSMTEIQ